MIADLWERIDAEFPEDTVPDRLARETLDHQAFARSRRQVYVGRPTDLNRLDEHVSNGDQPLVVLGDSGAGKSALIANWLHSHRAQLDEAGGSDKVLAHFVGATAASTDMMSMLERLIRALEPAISGRKGNQAKAGADLPAKPAGTRPTVLESPRHRQQRQPSRARDRRAQPARGRGRRPRSLVATKEIPPNVRLIVSTEGGRPLQELERRGCQALTVEPLSEAERGGLATAYLERYSKSLSTDMHKLVVSAEQTANPLFIRTLLEDSACLATTKHSLTSSDTILSTRSWICSTEC